MTEVTSPIEEVWSAVTVSDRLARWFGSYEGVGTVGGSVTLTMTAEEDAAGKPSTVHWYLDRLAATLAHVPMPDWAHYYPALRSTYS